MADMAADPTIATNPGPTRGFFLVLDGPDGGGKTTQAANLAGFLHAQGREVVTCRDPGGTDVGERLRAVLLDRETVNLTIRAEMLLYMASRAQLVEEVIRPALVRGAVVISDRFLLANLVYQGYAGGLDVEAIGRIGLEATAGLLPDLTIVLDVPVALARARVGRARDRIEDRPGAYHERVRAGFLKAAGEARAGGCSYYPAPVVVVDASGDPEAIAGRIRTEVERALALDPRR